MNGERLAFSPENMLSPTVSHIGADIDAVFMQVSCVLWRWAYFIWILNVTSPPPSLRSPNPIKSCLNIMGITLRDAYYQREAWIYFISRDMDFSAREVAIIGDVVIARSASVPAYMGKGILYNLWLLHPSKRWRERLCYTEWARLASIGTRIKGLRFIAKFSLFSSSNICLKKLGFMPVYS